MANLTKPTFKVTNISELSDKPNATDGLNSATFKALFDKSSLDAKTYLSGLCDELDTALTGKQKTITSGTADPTGGADGDIYFQYE